MLTRLTGHLKTNLVAYIALIVAVVFGGGGYAVAATSHKTTHKKKAATAVVACVSNSNGQMFLHRGSGKCSKGRHKVRWSIKGKPGKTGAAGASAPLVYAAVNAAAATTGVPNPVTSSQGISVSRQGVGVYQVTITDRTCVKTPSNVPVVTPTATDALGPISGTPVAYITNNDALGAFTVTEGYLNSSGTFVGDDLNFDVLDACQS